MSMPPKRFLVVSFPVHGHITPALRLSDRLALLGCHVTFLTTVLAHRTIVGAAAKTTPSNAAVSFATFSDGFDDGYKPRSRRQPDYKSYMAELRPRGSEALRGLVAAGLEEGRPYGCVVYTLLQLWAGEVAAEFDIPAAVLWTQSATGFDICYYYFHGFGGLIRESYTNRDDHLHSPKPLTFPGLDQLDGAFTVNDLPTFLDHSDPKGSIFLSFFEEQFDAIDKQSQRANVLVNTFDALEPEALRALVGYNNKIRLLGIGPLTRLDQSSDVVSDSNDSAVTEWLDSKPKGSVVFVSFGSIVVLARPQIEEIAKGLLELGRPFLWVIRKTDKKDQSDQSQDDEEENKLSCEEELREKGMIVPWCNQVRVLGHRALGCFVSHCGWNSSLESLAFGVPMVAFPQDYDQVTNARLIESVWKTGLRVKAKAKTSDSDSDSVVVGEELKRCLEVVLKEGNEFKRNAEKWKDLATQAIMEDGSSDKTLKAFVAEVFGE